MSKSHIYFRKRIREIHQLKKEIDTWLILSREWQTGNCHNRLMKEYTQLSYAPDELVDIVSGKWDEFHKSRNARKAINQIITDMRTELDSYTLLFTGHWGKHVARKYNTPKEETYRLKVSIQYISNSWRGLNIYNIIGVDGISDIRSIPRNDDILCIVTRFQVYNKEIIDEEIIYCYDGY